MRLFVFTTTRPRQWNKLLQIILLSAFILLLVIKSRNIQICYPKLTVLQQYRNKSTTCKIKSCQKTSNASLLLDERLKLSPVYYEDVGKMLDELNKKHQVKFKRNCPRIPKRIHQTWKTDMIPDQYNSSIRSWINNHPDWEYWLWTDKLVEELLEKRFIHYLTMFKQYKKGIMRGDALRYFILYEFGGVYIDLDMVALRPLNTILESPHTFLIPKDHPYHTYLVFGIHRIPLNALMISVQQHPILKAIIRALPSYTKQKDILWVAGPMMINEVISNYENSHRNGVSLCESMYIPEHDKFIPKFDEMNKLLFKKKSKRKNLSPKQKELFNVMIKSNFKQTETPKDALTVHSFDHVHFKKAKVLKLMKIDSIVDRRVDVKKEISKLEPSPCV